MSIRLISHCISHRTQSERAVPVEMIVPAAADHLILKWVEEVMSSSFAESAQRLLRRADILVATRVTQVCNMIAEVGRLLVFHCHISPWHAEVSTTTRTCASTTPSVTAVARDRHSGDSESAPKMLAPEKLGRQGWGMSMHSVNC